MNPFQTLIEFVNLISTPIDCFFQRGNRLFLIRNLFLVPLFTGTERGDGFIASLDRFSALVEPLVRVIDKNAAGLRNRRCICCDRNEIKRNPLVTGNELKFRFAALNEDFLDARSVHCSDRPDVRARMDALPQKTDIAKVTCQQFLEIIKVELPHVKWILVSRFVVIGKLVWRRHNEIAIGLQQPLYFF